MKFCYIKFIVIVWIIACKSLSAQNNQTQTLPIVIGIKVKLLIEKKAEYHRLTGGEQDGYQLKIHFGAEKDKARSVRSKFQQRFADINTYEEYQQPNFVILAGDFKTKLEAFQALKKIQGDFPSSFIVKGKIRLK